MNQTRAKPPAPANEEPELTQERDIPTDDDPTDEPSTEEPPEPEDDESVAGEEDPGAAMEPPP